MRLRPNLTRTFGIHLSLFHSYRTTTPHVAVIGAGPAGLVAAKTLLEHGYSVTAFEKETTLGGLWNYQRPPPTSNPGYHEKTADDDGFSYPVYNSLKMNTAMHCSSFSDFPPPAVHGHMSHTDMSDYLRRYASHFNLERHIHFNCNVKKLDKCGSQWTVNFEKYTEDQSQCFDKILVASGGFRFRNEPKFTNEHTFQGPIMHSSQVRQEDVLFSDKRVLLIGGGYSGIELASLALVNNAQHVDLIQSHSPGKRTWLWDRCTPTHSHSSQDSSHQTERLEWDYQITEDNWVSSNAYYELLMKSMFTLDGEMPDRFPDLSYDGTAITESVEFIHDNANTRRLESHNSPISSFTKHDVILENGEVLKDIDVVVKATGYQTRFPFLDHIYKRKQQQECATYLNMIPAEPELDGIAFVLIQRGLVVVPIAEIQARWLASRFIPRLYIEQTGLLFQDKERSMMQQEIDERRRMRHDKGALNYNKNPAKYMQSLAADIGCQPPDLEDLLQSNNLEDVELGVALRHGPFVISRFRVRGIHACENAKKDFLELCKSVLGEEFSSLVKYYVDRRRIQGSD